MKTPPPCSCPLAGYCPRYRRQVWPNQWRTCQKKATARRRWDRRANPGLGDKIAAAVERYSFGLVTDRRLSRLLRKLTRGRIVSCGCARRIVQLNRFGEWLNRRCGLNLA